MSNQLPESGAPPSPGSSGLFSTVIGRLFLLSTSLLLVLFVVRQFLELPDIVQVFRRVVSVAFLLSGGWLAVEVIALNRRWLLWRVRVKLILSYVFLGIVPVVLVVTFALAGGFILHISIASYLFHDGLQDLVDDVEQAAVTAAVDLQRNPGNAQTSLERSVAALSDRYPGASFLAIPAGQADAVPVASGGPWRHAAAPTEAPSWLGGRLFAGLLTYETSDGEPRLLIRAAAPLVLAGSPGFVIADLPVDTSIVAELDDRTGTRIRRVVPSPLPGAGTTGALSSASSSGGGDSGLMLFRRTVAFTDYIADWGEGREDRVGVSLEAPVGRLYDQLMSVQPNDLMLGGGVFLGLLAVVGVLFLVVQGAALVMGAMLARSITYAVHALFVGTERIQQGDFSHRIEIPARDQLGDLAASFNRMSASIERLLNVQREKQRLDEELRIAREIQRSLLPEQLPVMDGIELADLCEPAREVGGDYYDFFVLGPRRLGLMIADVAGKGTSAALYMAELKGLMLALSHEEPSPRQLLVELNQRLAGQLDNRSFITMTYAVIDLERRELTFARAGHTPLIVVSGGESQVLQPDGMVLGLRLPGAEERFGELLCEQTLPIHAGDVVVMYTDGVTEAMDTEGELFGDAALAQLLARHHESGATEIREQVVDAVKAFVHDAEPHDDMTMIVLKVHPEAFA